jgi:hypothetical protein
LFQSLRARCWLLETYRNYSEAAFDSLICMEAVG